MKPWSPLDGIDNYVDDKSKKFIPEFKFDCESWMQACREQVDLEKRGKSNLIYVRRIGPNKFDLKLQIGYVIVDWFGSAHCEQCAVAKAYQDYYEEQI